MRVSVKMSKYLGAQAMSCNIPRKNGIENKPQWAFLRQNLLNKFGGFNFMCVVASQIPSSSLPHPLGVARAICPRKCHVNLIRVPENCQLLLTNVTADCYTPTLAPEIAQAAALYPSNNPGHKVAPGRIGSLQLCWIVFLK